MNALTLIIAGLERKGIPHQYHGLTSAEDAKPGLSDGDLHYHESWEIKIPLKGRLPCRFTRRNICLPQYAALLIAPKIIHYTMLPTDIHHSHAWLNCLFENGDVRLMLTQNCHASYYFLSSDQKSELTTLLGRTPNEFCGQIALALTRVKATDAQNPAGKWLFIFFSSLMSALVCAPALSSPQHEIVSRAIALLNNMSGDADLTVGRMAKMLNISSKYLTSVFHRLTGATPRQKLIHIRLERAWRLLQTGNFSVKEVAAFTGWRNQFYFSNAFRRHYGMTPSQTPGRQSQTA